MNDGKRDVHLKDQSKDKDKDGKDKGADNINVIKIDEAMVASLKQTNFLNTDPEDNHLT